MSEVKELEVYIKHLKNVIELSDKLKRLEINSDFKDIIQEGFCKEEMARYLSLAVSDKVSAENRDLYNRLAQSSAALDNYLAFIHIKGDQARNELPEVEDQLEELKAQEIE